jgi:hypothetical protein
MVGNQGGITAIKGEGTRDMTDVKSPEARSETESLRYQRQTRNATVFIAWVVGVLVALSIIFGIIAGVQLAKINTNLTGGGSGGSTSCVSQGGTLPC